MGSGMHSDTKFGQRGWGIVMLVPRIKGSGAFGHKNPPGHNPEETSPIFMVFLDMFTDTTLITGI
jgi:hypothetical protein